MAFNYYEGWSEAKLLDLRTRLQSAVSTGSVTRTSIAGVSVEKASKTGPENTAELKRVCYALFLLGAAKVAAGDEVTNPYTNPYASSVKRTRTTYL